MDDWVRFLVPADEWFVNYVVAPSVFATIPLFSVGHAVELYLKSVYTKCTGNLNKAIKYSHAIPGLLEECQRLDSNFLAGYELR